MHDLTKELALARRLAIEAGKLLRDMRKTSNIVNQPYGTTYLDVSTSADLASEKLIIEGIEAAYPEDIILSEETRALKPTSNARLWIIDPLDGTTNYVKGLDSYGVSIALYDNGRVVMAVVYLPETESEYHAVRGAGVFRNTEKLSLIAPEDTLAQSLVSVGFPHTRNEKVLVHAFDLYRAVLSASSDLRRSGSAICDTCLLAEGVTGVYLTPDIKPWDITAMNLFIEEQGGVMTDFSGVPVDLFRREDERYSIAVLAAKNPTIHMELVSLIGRISKRT